MELINLKKCIYARLDALTTITVYDGQLPINDDDITFPYVIYKLTGSTIEENRYNYICELNYWNNSNDDSSILEAANDIKQGFNHYWETSTDGFYTSDIDFEAQLDDVDKNISRINQRYILKVR